MATLSLLVYQGSLWHHYVYSHECGGVASLGPRDHVLGLLQPAGVIYIGCQLTSASSTSYVQ